MEKPNKRFSKPRDTGKKPSYKSDSKSSSGKRTFKSDKDTEKPSKPRFDKRGLRSDKPNNEKPFRKREDGDKKFDRPFKKRDNDSDSKPSYRDKDKSFDRDKKPFRKREDGDKKFDRPFKKRDNDRDSKPSYRDKDKSFDRDKKPFRKREDGDKKFDRPYKKRDDDRDNKPSYRDKDKSFDRDKKPFRKGEDGDKKFDRPFKKREDDDREEFASDDNKKHDDRKDHDRGYKKTYSKHQDKKHKSKHEESHVSKHTDGSIRLNKYLSNAGVCSRREADELIKAGTVTVNGKIITELGFRVNPSDKINYGGETLRHEKKVYLILNKPKDYLTTTDDPRERRTVMELIHGACKERIYPVGRLDRNTTGLLLFTNDGEMSTKLMHPKHGIRKVYHVLLDHNMKPADYAKLHEGIELEDGFIKPDDVSFTGDTKKEIGIEIHSGKNRIVRRIFEHLGYNVLKLDRVVFAGLTKKDLPRGKWRLLNEKEIGFLKMIG